MRLWNRRMNKRWSGILVVCLAVFTAMLFLTEKTALAKPIVKFGVITTTKYPIFKHQWLAAKFAAEEINAAGGVKIGGVMHELQVIKAESNEISSVTDAANAMERLLTVDKVAAVTGGIRGEAVLAMMEVMADNKVIFISSGAGTIETSEKVGKNYDKYKYYFRNTAVNVAYMAKIQFALADLTATRIREELGIKVPKVALLLEKAMWANRMIKYANALLPKMGMEIVGVWQPSPNATDVTAELTAIRSAGAHMIFLGVTGPVSVAIARQWGGLKIPAAMVGVDAFSLWQGFWKATGGMCEYEIAYGFYADDAAVTPKTLPFVKKYIQKYNEKPTFVAGSYDAIYIWKEAVERAGTLDSDAVVAELEKTDYTGTQGRVVFFPKGHRWAHDVMWGPGKVTSVGFQWIKGKQKCIWPDGRLLFPAISTDPGWKGLRYKGTRDIQLPPWMLKHWQNK